MDNSELRNHIKEKRTSFGITQEELAASIGVTRKTINTIETGKFIPSTILAIRLARFFKIKVEDLFQLEDAKND